MYVQLSDESLETLLHAFRTTSGRYAEAKATRVKFEEARKIQKARLMIQAEANAGISSTPKQERYAYAHEDYLATVRHLQTAVELETRLYWELETMRIEFDAWRTLQASERYEKGAYRVPPGGANTKATAQPSSRASQDDGLL